MKLDSTSGRMKKKSRTVQMLCYNEKSYTRHRYQTQIYKIASFAFARLRQLSSINSIMYNSLNVSNGIGEQSELFFFLFRRFHANIVNSQCRRTTQKKRWVPNLNGTVKRHVGCCWFSDFFSLIIFSAHEANTPAFTFVCRRQVTPFRILCTLEESHTFQQWLQISTRKPFRH